MKLAENETKIAELKSQAYELALKISNHGFTMLNAKEFKKASRLFGRSKALSPFLADSDLGILLANAKLNDVFNLLDENLCSQVDEQELSFLTYNKDKTLSCDEYRTIVENVIARINEKEKDRKRKEEEDQWEQRRIESASMYSDSTSNYSSNTTDRSGGGSGCLRKIGIFAVIAFGIYFLSFCSLL